MKLFVRVLHGASAFFVAGIMLLLLPQACQTTGDLMVDAGEWLRDSSDPVPPAHAAEGGSTCAQWEVTMRDDRCQADASRPVLTDGESCELPEGWEPIGYNGTVNSFLLRRCIR